MESQEVKMLHFLFDYQESNNRPNFLNKIRELFRDSDFAFSLIDNLNKNGYTYIKISDERINLGNTKCLLTDKGHKYLEGNKLQKYLIEHDINWSLIWDVLKNIAKIKV